MTLPGGYCTRKCAADAECGGAACGAYGFDRAGIDGGITRSCFARCDESHACRAGYACVPIELATGGRARGCWTAP